MQGVVVGVCMIESGIGEVVDVGVWLREVMADVPSVVC